MDDRNPTSDRLRRLASRYEAGVGRGRAEQIASRAITRAHRRPSPGRRFAVAVSSGAFMLVSLTGVGMAADRAIPGDLLYPLDRALERVGFTSNLVEERLQEALVLLERGELTLAIATANEALVELGRSGVTVSFPEIVQVTDDTLVETVTTTTNGPVVEVAPAVEDETPGTQAPSEVVVEATAEPSSPGETLRLAAEQLLASVRSAKSDSGSTEDVVSAALFLAETTASASTEEVAVEGTEDTTTSTSTTSSTSSTTTTTVPEENTNGQGMGTTTTTLTPEPDDGSDDSTGDGQDDPPGPIFLPSP